MKEFVSYIVFEGEMARLERIIKKLWIICIVLLIALFGTNIAWIYYSQFDNNQNRNVISNDTVIYGKDIKE